MTALRAITVDFWGTLIHDQPRADDHYRERRLADFAAILGKAGIRVAPRSLSRGYDVSGRELSWVWSQNRDVPVLRHVTSLLEGAEAGLSARLSRAVVDELIEAYGRPALLAPPRPAPGAAEALAALRERGLRLAVVSNTMRTPGAVLRTLLDRQGLLAPFEHLTFSDEVGVRKPGAQIFHLTLAKLGVEAAEAVHVGDDAVLDVLGARSAGLRVVQVTAAALAADSIRPDVVIEKLADLPDAIAMLAEPARRG
jgi:putative hydrolase of the HAD superfamily